MKHVLMPDETFAIAQKGAGEIVIPIPEDGRELLVQQTDILKMSAKLSLAFGGVENGKLQFSDDAGAFLLVFKDTETPGSFELKKAVRAHVLAVGGGGAGANPGNAGLSDGGAGGGGAGGFVENESLVLAPGVYSVVVGKGGTNTVSTQQAGENGYPSYISLGGVDKIRALGGGGGGILTAAGGAGGSGGGGGNSYGNALQPASEWGGLGNRGGSVNNTRAGAGGGGAGGVGGNVSVRNEGGAGGAGTNSWITGSEIWYAAGGGGGSRTGTGGAGGLDGNGNPLGGAGGGGSSTAPVSPGNGLAGTGSGGGGGRLNGTGGSGGSGVVIVRIPLSYLYGGPMHNETMPETPTQEEMINIVKKMFVALGGEVARNV